MGMSFRSNAAETWDPQPDDSPEQVEVNLLLPRSVSQPLWKSLLGNLRDTFAPEKLPALQLVSRPIDLGVPLGERLRLPWYRSVFTNLGDVISPEALPPLELESAPQDVGELITDQLSHLWISSLLRNLADRFVPERLPKLEVTAKPIANFDRDTWLLLPAWSEVISTPKVFYPDKPRAASTPLTMPLATPMPALPALPPTHPAQARLARELRRSRIRTYIWMGMAAAQAIYLVVMIFLPS